MRATAGRIKCEICHRLKKDCVTQSPSVRVYKPQKTTRVAQLEKKLDGIVNLLQQQQQQKQDVHSQDTTPAFSPLATNGNILPGSSLLSEPEPPNQIPYRDTSHLVPKPLEPSKRQSVYEKSTNACLLAHANSDLEPNDMEIERLVKLYQMEMTARFPFVVIETGGLTGKEWVASKPVLGKAVLMAASYYNLPRQTVYETALVRDLTERIMVKRDKTLELLQTILVFCGWYHYHCLGHPHLNNLLGLATGLAGDLGLSKPPSADRFKYPFGHSRATAGDFSRRTMEQRRALAGLFYLTSLVATGFQRIDTMRYSIHLDECVRFIEKNTEHTTDLLLVELVKISHLGDKIGQDVLLVQSDSGIQVPTALKLGSFQVELDVLKKGVPSALGDDVLSISPSTYLSQPIAPWSLLAYALMVLARLSFYQNPLLPSWTLDFVREVCDLSWVLKELAERNDRAKFVDINITTEDGEWGRDAEVGSDGRRVGEGWTDCFDKFARKIRLVKGWYDQRAAAYGSSAQPHPLGDGFRVDRNAVEGIGDGSEDITEGGTLTQIDTRLEEAVNAQVNSDSIPVLGEMDMNSWDGFDGQNFWMDLGGEWDIDGLEAMGAIL
ncbi:hypothetical protein ACHAPG_002816 [Botrytis cinerea]